MPLSLRETQAIAALANHLYDYLPASGARVTFGEVAVDAGVANLWPGVREMSKLPALIELLRRTLELRRDRFCTLIELVVREGLEYRTRKGNPLTRDSLVQLNRLVAGVGFKIPELWDSEFLDGLPAESAAATPQPPPRPPLAPAQQERTRDLEPLRSEFLALSSMKNRAQAGLAFERLLYRLFDSFGLAPSGPFRVVGEQIDGSFVLDTAVYLLEAKWTTTPVDQKELYAFRAKVEGKSSYTRGLFVSVAGFTGPAVEAVCQNKTPNFVMLDGAHIFRVLDGQMHLDVMLRRLVRHLAERGSPYLPVAEIL